MKMNWKLRFQNKVTLAAILASVIALVYQICGLCGVVPAVSESEVTNIVSMVLNLLVMLGVLVDPTTSGVSDSERAMSYKKPM